MIQDDVGGVEVGRDLVQVLHHVLGTQVADRRFQLGGRSGDLFEKKILNSIFVAAKLEENIISNLPPSSNVSPSSVLTFDLKYNFLIRERLKKKKFKKKTNKC